MLVLWMALGCSAPLYIDYSQLGCDEYDFEDPSQSQLTTTQSGADVLVSRINVVAGCDALFAPELSSDGSSIAVREYWSQSSADCETCFSPTITIEDAPSRAIEVRWYLEDAADPFGTVQIN